MSTKYAIRAAQIDLNRQYEPMSFIREYIDFLAGNGYNALILYIAWRVSINSHPWQVPGGSYTRDDIKAIVAYAHEKGLQVIPTTNLTFVNSLTRFPELKELMETGTRFWGSHRGNFCTLNPKVYEFIENYLTELAELIPSEYFHIGGDETWDLGFCEHCTKDGFDFAKECRLYRDFILKVHSIVVNKLKRRVIMWDDMFEYYPTVLPEMPRDIVMAHWVYDDDVTVTRGHFGNRHREHRLAQYEKLGFEYLIAPHARCSANARTFTEYAAEGNHLLGAIMTTWCVHLRFMYKAFPAIAAAGRLWAKGGDEAQHFKEAIADLLGVDKAQLTAAFRAFCEETMMRISNYSAGWLATMPFEGFGYGTYAKHKLMLAVMKEHQSLVTTELGRKVIKEVIISLELCCAFFDLKLDFRRLLENPAKEGNFASSLENVRQLGETYAALWNEWRPNIAPNCLADWFANFIKEAEKLAKQFRSGNYLRILFALPNAYGAEMTTITLLENGQETVLAQSVFKSGATFYERFFPLAANQKPEAVKIAMKGYGGQGVAHVAMRLNGQNIKPRQVCSDGQVCNETFVLDDDCKYAFLGEPDSAKAWQNRPIAEQVSSITVHF